MEIPFFQRRKILSTALWTLMNWHILQKHGYFWNRICIDSICGWYLCPNNHKHKGICLWYVLWISWYCIHADELNWMLECSNFICASLKRINYVQNEKKKQVGDRQWPKLRYIYSMINVRKSHSISVRCRGKIQKILIHTDKLH